MTMSQGNSKGSERMQAERLIIEGAGHTMGCWEYGVEELIEAADAQGVKLAGHHDEIYRNKTLMDTVIDGLDRDQIECRCPC